MSTADGYVLPKPGVPKTLGILNVIFGVLLLLFGTCTLGILLFGGTALEMAKKVGDEAQAKVAEQGKAQVKAIDDQIAAAKDDEAKKALETEKANLIANQPKLNPIDMSGATAALKNPTVMGFNYAYGISGLILHVILLISGIGLIRLTPWGRTLGVWWGGLQILQVLVMLGVGLAVVMPQNKAIAEQQLAKLEEAAKAPGAGPNEAAALQISQAATSMQVPLYVGQSLAGLIYPIILLILLNTVGARAACLAKKPPGIDPFGTPQPLS